MIKCLQTRDFYAVHIDSLDTGDLIAGIVFVGGQCSQKNPLSIVNTESGQTFKIKAIPPGVYKNQELELWHT